MKFVSDLRLVSGFLHVLQIPPPIKLTTMNMLICCFDTYLLPLLLYMLFMVHWLLWFDGTNENHENWYSVNSQLFNLHTCILNWAIVVWGLLHWYRGNWSDSKPKCNRSTRKCTATTTRHFQQRLGF
jgi:hypothetical protein